MSEGDAHDPLRELGRRLDAARGAAGKGPETRPPRGGPAMGSALSLGLRIGVELVVAVLVATGIGWAIDHWLGTRPWALIVMFFLGIAAGTLNVWRALSGLGMTMGYPRQDGAQPQDDDED